MYKLLLAMFVMAGSCFAQLTSEQKVADFKTLASLYAKQYAPYHWKKELLGYDAYDISRWLEQVQVSKSDLEFFEVMTKYVASLQDVHSLYDNSSGFRADAGFRVDIYDGKFLIDSINRSHLPESTYPFQLGDELVSMDGQSASDLADQFAPFIGFGNPLSQRRYAATFIGVRAQYIYPRAVEVGDKTTITVKRQSGDVEAYTIPWLKAGFPLRQSGPVPGPGLTSEKLSHRASSGDDDAKPYFDPRHPLTRYQVMKSKLDPSFKEVRSIGARAPIFTLPTDFVQRLGRRTSDYFYSGTYKSEGKTIGFIRISDFEPTAYADLIFPLSQFASEIAYMKANTDGLVVDIMRNPGGFGCYGEELVSFLTTDRFPSMAVQYRPTLADVQAYFTPVQDPGAFNLEEWEYNLVKAQFDMVYGAYQSNGGLTGRIPVCQFDVTRDPARDQRGNVSGYPKAVLLLTDEFSISAADFFAALMQDAGRGKQFGIRTSGAGGSVVYGNNAGYYSEGTAGVTQTIGIRPNAVAAPGYPSTYYIENVGVHPDIKVDYMTADNLLQRGAPFVSAFTKAIVDQINTGK